MLELRGVQKLFHLGTPAVTRALRSIDLTIDEGSFVVIVGNNGAGKSVLLNAIMGTYPIEAGTIHLDGQDITAWPEHRRGQIIGRVWQNPAAGSAAGLMIVDNLALACRRRDRHGLHRHLPFWMRRKIIDRLEQLEIPWKDRLRDGANKLSPGERQMLAVLMATWGPPRLLLLDDHVASLDPKSADYVLDLTRRIIDQHKLTTLMVTHSLTHAVNLGDRVLIMHQGRIVDDLRGAEKKRLRADDLLARFEVLRRRDLLDESAAELLRRMYV